MTKFSALKNMPFGDVINLHRCLSGKGGLAGLNFILERLHAN